MQTHRFIQLTPPNDNIIVRIEPVTTSDDPLTSEERAIHILANKVEILENTMREIKNLSEDIERSTVPLRVTIIAMDIFDLIRKALK